MRRAIIARPGHIFISTDFKQMEMRFFGILSQDPFMLDALLSGKDVHLSIALKVWGDCGNDMNMVHREWSKTITFGLIYGMTLGSLQFKLNMTKPQAAKITDDYWKEFPRIKPWMNEIVATCKRDLFLRYWSGRIWREDNPLDMYKGVNALIQGGCADLLSIAAMRVDEFNDTLPSNHLVNLVHDETITECLVDDLLPSIRNIAEIMKVPDLMGVPFATDVKIGPSYGVMGKVAKELYLDPNTTHIDMGSILSEDGEYLSSDDPDEEEEEEAEIAE
jgi:DNA polymerase-1